MFSAYLHDKIEAKKEIQKAEQFNEAMKRNLIHQKKKKLKKSDSVGSMSSHEDPTPEELAILRVQCKYSFYYQANVSFCVLNWLRKKVQTGIGLPKSCRNFHQPDVAQTENS